MLFFAAAAASCASTAGLVGARKDVGQLQLSAGQTSSALDTAAARGSEGASADATMATDSSLGANSLTSVEIDAFASLDKKKKYKNVHKPVDQKDPCREFLLKCEKAAKLVNKGHANALDAWHKGDTGDDAATKVACHYCKRKKEGSCDGAKCKDGNASYEPVYRKCQKVHSCEYCTSDAKPGHCKIKSYKKNGKSHCKPQCVE